ncbi:MAG: hypothetical protein ACI4XJ_05675 [Eubacteriales bacterium]
MPKKKIIDGIIFFPLKKHDEAICVKCERYINSEKTAYATSTINPTKLLCVDCMNHMAAQNLQVKEKNAVEYPKDRELYIGTTHKCSNCVFEKQFFFFCKDGKSKKIVVKKCLVCDNYFLDFKNYEHNLFYLDEYLLFRSSTGKEMIKFEQSENYLPSRKTEQEQIDIPDTVRWAATHPYQGGGCSGK